MVTIGSLQRYPAGHRHDQLSRYSAGGGEDRLFTSLNLGILSGHIGPTVRVVRNLTASRVAEALTPLGLTAQSFAVIALIAANDGCSQSEIARETALDKSAIVSLLDNLEERGIISRSRSDVDRRRHVLSLTAKGLAFHAELENVAWVLEQPIRDALSPGEIAQLASLLRRARAAMEAARSD